MKMIVSNQIKYFLPIVICFLLKNQLLLKKQNLDIGKEIKLLTGQTISNLTRKIDCIWSDYLSIYQ